MPPYICCTFSVLSCTRFSHPPHAARMNVGSAPIERTVLLQGGQIDFGHLPFIEMTKIQSMNHMPN